MNKKQEKENKKIINICFHIWNISNCGGTEKVTTQIANFLIEKYDYYNIYILSTYYDLESGPFFKGNTKIKYARIFDKYTRIRLRKWKTIEKIKEFVIKNKIDILVGVDTILSVFDIPSVKNTNCKYVAWEHFNFYSNLGVHLRDKGRKLSAKEADALVVLSKKDYENFNKNLKIKTRLLQIYNPFIYDNSESSTYNEKSKTILSSGRLTYQKGFDLLIEVADKVKKQVKDFEWLILGDGEDKKNLLKKVKEFNLEDNVKFIGKVKNVKDYYQKSKFFVLTSRFEGLVLVILEAKSNNLPVISFDCNCGPDEMITDGVNGYLIPPFDINMMADKIIELLKNNNKCYNMSKESLNEMNNFNQTTIIKKWDSLLTSLVNYNNKL